MRRSALRCCQCLQGTVRWIVLYCLFFSPAIPQVMASILSDFSSKTWMTYRSAFPPLGNAFILFQASLLMLMDK